MDFNLEEYNKFIEKHVLSHMGITYSNLKERGLAFDAPGV